MANKKKSKSKQKKSKRRTSSAKSKATQSTAKAKTAKKKRANPTSRKEAASKASDKRKKRASISPEREIKREIRNRDLARGRAESGVRSADFGGLSRAEQADSESVDELVEEGNVFEAGAIAGVEEADDADEKEVHTHELPEDDVPGEYLDKD
jgi:N utilization substance protein A